MSLYLKYRPQDFKNLVGQSFIKDTLSKAITDDKTVGAYLFCGPRGTGKTSTARIFAKAINCLDPKNGNPCLECNICKDFLEDRLMDIIEIDAASNTGVENIRDIIERAQFSPTNTKYKVYIIDEVHMLSKGAFNALLKILEEPPKHVKFILATTETHKVPETIISRCQRYDFKRISSEDIKDRLGFIAKSENIKTDIKSIEYIIKNAGGGLRNAISLFEQLIFNSELNYEEIIKKLEIVDENILEIFLEKLLNKDREVITTFEKLIEDGKNLKLFFKELLFYSKDQSLRLLKNNEDISEYINIMEILDETYSKTKNSLDENTTFLIGVLKIIQNNNNSQINFSTLENKEATKKINKTNLDNSSIKEENKEAKKIENNKQELNKDDIIDIFGEDEQKSDIKNKEETKINLNLEDFINKLKKHKAKGGLTMALRGGIFSINGNELNIKLKTKISKSQLENVENMALVSKVLIEMGFNNPTIKIN